jgi:hypothetical protein
MYSNKEKTRGEPRHFTSGLYCFGYTNASKLIPSIMSLGIPHRRTGTITLNHGSGFLAGNEFSSVTSKNSFFPSYTRISKPLTSITPLGVYSHRTGTIVKSTPPGYNPDYVFRPSKNNDTIPLEGGGMLKLTAKLQIADRKSLGIKTKGRQLSLMYKVEIGKTKETLNSLIQNQFIDPVNKTQSSKLASYSQEFHATVNGVAVQAFIPESALGINPLGDGNQYMKTVSFYLLAAYDDLSKEPGSKLPTLERLAPQPFNIDLTNTDNCNGFIGVIKTSSLFKGTSDIVETATFSKMLPESIRGIDFINGKTDVPVKEVPSSTIFSHFDGFASLPIVISLQNIVKPKTKKTGALKFLLADQPYLPFLIRSMEYGDLENPSPSAPIEIVLQERITRYVVDNAVVQDVKVNDPFIGYVYHEDDVFWQRAVVKPDYLATLIDNTLIRRIRKLHTSRIVYNSLKLTSFNKKKWSADGKVCAKGNLNTLLSKEIEYNVMVTGSHPGDGVNYITNLLFTARFDSNQSNFYRSNRFVTCSAFMNQSELNDLSSRVLFAELEQAFCEPIVLSTYPEVRLIPCFERGTDIQIANSVQFRGLVSNAASTQDFS